MMFVDVQSKRRIPSIYLFKQALFAFKPANPDEDLFSCKIYGNFLLKIKVFHTKLRVRKRNQRTQVQ